ncbi:MAG: dihydrolipoyl dehydrogenase [Pseudoflavonifractor sp.]
MYYKMNDYEFIVIGAGPGGYVAALQAAKLGLHVAVVENREVGGTCLNRGCIPTKTMLHSSRLYREMLDSQEMGISAERVQVDIGSIYARKREISNKLSSGIEGMFKNAKIDLLCGIGKILAPHTVQVTGADGEKTYTADSIMVATGSVPSRPPIPGLDLPGVMTSDELLEGCDHLYRSIVIVGGGVIGVEFATFYADLGCAVTIVEGLDRLLPNMDREISQNLTQILKKRGIQIYTKAMVQSVTRAETGLTVNFSVKDTPTSVSGEVVLCSIGRRPYTEGLFAPELVPEFNGRSLKVDEHYQTSIPQVYAIGDVSSRIQLAHVASAQGIACVDMLCGKTPSVDLSIVPSCVYCRPEIACVGLTEQEAKDAGIAVKTGKAVLFSNARTMIDGSDRSFMKVVARTDNHQIIGAQFMCERSTDMISQIAQAIANHLTAEQLLQAMRPHPTFEEALGDCLEALVGNF